MRYIINERQYKLITEEEEQEILHIPSLDLFGDWETLQKFLGRRGYPLYSVGGNLDLRRANIKSLGNLTSVGGNLDLEGTNIESLGALTSVGGNLDLEGTNIESLGALTSVGGSLYLFRTNIKSLGNLTSVGGNLDLSRTPLSKKYTIEEIKRMVKVGGDIYL